MYLVPFRPAAAAPVREIYKAYEGKGLLLTGIVVTACQGSHGFQGGSSLSLRIVYFFSW